MVEKHNDVSGTMYYFQKVVVDETNNKIEAYSGGSKIERTLADDEIVFKDVCVYIDSVGILTVNPKYVLGRMYVYNSLNSMVMDDFWIPTSSDIVIKVPYHENITVKFSDLDISDYKTVGGNWWWWFCNSGNHKKPKGKGKQYIDIYSGWQGKFVESKIKLNFHNWQLIIHE